jgi:hypothetical protein
LEKLFFGAGSSSSSLFNNGRPHRVSTPYTVAQEARWVEKGHVLTIYSAYVAAGNKPDKEIGKYTLLHRQSTRARMAEQNNILTGSTEHDAKKQAAWALVGEP